MKLGELYRSLKEARDRVAALNIRDHAYYDLVIQVAQLKKEIAVESFNVDDELKGVSAPDLAALRQHTAALKAATSAEQVGAGTIGKIASIGRLAIRALGLPII